MHPLIRWIKRPDFTGGRLKSWRGDAFAIAATAAALGLRIAVDKQFAGQPALVIFIIAIMLTAYLGRLRAGLLATGLSIFVIAYFLLPPTHTLKIASTADRWRLLFVTLIGGLVSVFMEALHRARDHALMAARRAAEAAAADARQHVVVLKQAKEALRMTAARVRGLVDSAMDAIISIDSEQRIVLFNAAAEKMFRCTAADALWQNLDQFIPERFREQHRRHIEGFGKTGVTSRAMRSPRPTLIGVRADGEEFFIEASISQLDHGGQKLFSVILRDVTERKQAEETLARTNEQFRLFIEHAPAAIAMLDAEMRYLAVSERFLADYGLVGEDLRGRSHYEVFPEIPGRWKAIHRRCLAGAVERGEEEALKRADGRTQWIRWEIHPWPDTSGVGGIIIFSEDVSEQRRAEGRVRRLMDSNAQGVIFWNMNGAITKANDAFLKLVGYSRDDLDAGRLNWKTLTPPEYVDADRRSLEELAARGFCPPTEKEYIRQDGGRVPVIVGAAVFEDNRQEGVCFVIDRTESQRAEATMALLAGIVASSSDAVIGKDFNGIVTSWNAAAERIFGYSAEEMIGQSIRRIIPQDRMADEEMILARIRAGEAVEHFETERLRKDGELVAVSVSISPIKDSRGRLVGASKVARDITERNRAAEALRASQAQLQTIVENIEAAVVVSDLDGKLLHFNRVALKSLGYAGAEDGRRQMNELVDTFELSGIDGIPWSVDEWPLARILRGERLRDVQGRMRRIGADWDRVFSFSGTQVQDACGKPLMAIVTFSDITERKRADASLREGEERFRTMANSIPQLAWIARPDGFIFWYNQRWYEYTGTTPEQMEGWGWQSVHDPEILPRVIKRWNAAIESVQPFEMEFPLRGADGRFRTHLTRVQPFKDSQGRLVQWFGTNTDIEILKQAEETVRGLNSDLERRVAERTASLEAANKELESFSYSVSHDLRTPLRSIDGFSQALLEDNEGKLDVQSQDHLRRIRAASQRMGHLIDDLLNLARVTRAELRRETVDLSKIACNVIEELRAGSSGRNVDVVISDGLFEEADPHLLRIVLANLLGNAWKFTRDTSQARIEFGHCDEEGKTGYFVRDNGAGFDMTFVAKLFGAFQRLHSTTEFPGTGIGLATVQRIIHRHGGRVWAEGNVNTGATFYFTASVSPQGAPVLLAA